MVRQPHTYTATFALLAAVTFGTAATNLPDEIAASGEKVVLQVHAEGAQIYECKATASGQLSWQFREPIAALVRDGVTVGRHYGGPTWEIEGSSVAGKVAGHAPGATAGDIPWLRLNVADKRGDGPFKDVTTVQRINTKGGNFEGRCNKAGDLYAQSYSADYVFLRKAP
jgi:hypothetical protein